MQILRSPDRLVLTAIWLTQSVGSSTLASTSSFSRSLSIFLTAGFSATATRLAGLISGGWASSVTSLTRPGRLPSPSLIVLGYALKGWSCSSHQRVYMLKGFIMMVMRPICSAVFLLSRGVGSLSTITNGAQYLPPDLGLRTLTASLPTALMVEPFHILRVIWLLEILSYSLTVKCFSGRTFTVAPQSIWNFTSLSLHFSPTSMVQ